MSKTPKKIVKNTGRKPVKKPTAKAGAAKPKMKMKASMKPKAGQKGSRRGFLWKVLEQKQQKQKEHGVAGPVSANPMDRVQTNATKNGFARFNGPRRRVG